MHYDTQVICGWKKGGCVLRSVARKTLSVVKGAALFGGAVVTLALVFGVASTALGANGEPWLLGKADNTATRLTALVSDIANPNQAALQVRNSGDGPALDLRVGTPGSGPAAKTVAPMRVNSQVNVANLNADQLDGNHASDFLGSGVVVRTEEDDLDDADTSATDTALCEDGEVATGGGAAIVLDAAGEGTPPNNGEFVVAASRPALLGGADAPPTGWQASIFDFDGDASANGAFTLRVYAVCTNVGAAAPTP